ncbi:nucleolar and spindle-associated protein 1 isoform X3 [Equus przewalskii]|uniref:Nucleolar and spindle associated protein 1 n=2 Tax=Equus TaxID=9789 RepID=F6XQL3_HORSE|nr:nucleolar and spindle-associated protein 1 isoform X3 [Equus caballus]XP_008538051.1 PREDICTED: nucleolar and spindle-associated protein 1 isoform X4 [Equus przewalskii]
MTVPSLEELDSFKYSDLQNLAKSLGLRANLRANKLLKALKAHLRNEARKENENQATEGVSTVQIHGKEIINVTKDTQMGKLPDPQSSPGECTGVDHIGPSGSLILPLQDKNQTSSSSSDETKMQISSQEQAEKEPVGHVTKTRRRRGTVHRNPDSQQDHSEIKVSGPTELQNPDEQGNQAARPAAEVPSPPDESQGDKNAASSGRSAGNDFKKLHEARFKEMESIDQYIERKKKHFEEHNSFNELKKQLISKGVVATPVPLQGRRSVAHTPASQRRLQGRPHSAAGRSTLCAKGSAKHSALSATKMNVRFSAATKDNEHKRSLTKTPARKSPLVTIPGSTPKGQAVLGTHKLKTTSRDSAAVITPFKLTAEAAPTPVSQKKPVFDLKASLSRPLNYEPHKGKLKPWGQSKENRVSLYKRTYKQPHLQTREEQRKKHEQERKEKKAKVLGARRGLMAEN